MERPSLSPQLSIQIVTVLHAIVRKKDHLMMNIVLRLPYRFTVSIVLNHALTNYKKAYLCTVYYKCHKVKGSKELNVTISNELYIEADCKSS